MTVEYQCARGYAGRPSATCGPDGNWKFVGDERCSLIGCGSLQIFLQHRLTWKDGHSVGWQETMTMTGSHDLDRSYMGETVHFTCSSGYWGRPVALCHDGGWEISDPCVAFETSSKCHCKARWVHCKGFLLTDCKEYFGCALGSESYTWCEVDPGSCPEEARDPFGLQPAWDYCVNDNFDIKWRPKQVADKSVLSKLAGLYIGGAFILAAICAFFLFHYSALALSKLAEVVVYLILQVLLFFVRCIYRIPRALRRHSRVCGWRLHRLSDRGSKALLAAFVSFKRKLQRSQSQENDLTSALLEEGSDSAATPSFMDVREWRCWSWRPFKSCFSLKGSNKL